MVGVMKRLKNIFLNMIFIVQNVAKSDLEAIQIYYYTNYDFHSRFDSIESLQSNFDNTMTQYTILEQGSFNMNGQNVLYYVLDKLDPTRTSVAYFIIIDNGMLELYTHLMKDNFNEKSKQLSDSIIKSIKIANNTMY